MPCCLLHAPCSPVPCCPLPAPAPHSRCPMLPRAMLPPSRAMLPPSRAVPPPSRAVLLPPRAGSPLPAPRAPPTVGEEEEYEEEEEKEGERKGGGGPPSKRKKVQSLFRRLSSGPVRLRVHDVVIRGNAKTKAPALRCYSRGPVTVPLPSPPFPLPRHPRGPTITTVPVAPPSPLCCSDYLVKIYLNLTSPFIL